MRRVIILLATMVISFGQQAHADLEVSIGGLIEIGLKKIDHENIDNEVGDPEAGDIEVNIDARLNEKVSGNLLLRPDTPDEILDEATITIEDFSEEPLFITIGKTVMPFGVFNSHLVSDPWTKENDLLTWETNAVGIIGHYAHKKIEVACAIYDSSDLKDPGALAGQLSVMPTEEITFGASYKSYYKDGKDEAFEYADLSGMIEVVVGQVTVDVEYSGATTREKDAPRPSACSVGLAFQVIDPLELALRYDSLNDDDKDTINVESRIGGGFNWKLFEAVTLSAEYGVVKEEENGKDEEETPGNRNEFFARLAIEF